MPNVHQSPYNVSKYCNPLLINKNNPYSHQEATAAAPLLLLLSTLQLLNPGFKLRLLLIDRLQLLPGLLVLPISYNPA